MTDEEQRRIANANKNLKNKIFLFRNDEEKDINEQDEDAKNSHNIEVVESRPKIVVEAIQVGEEWIKARFQNGSTYLFDMSQSIDLRRQKLDSFKATDFGQWDNMIASKVARMDNSRFKSCERCSFKYQYLDQVAEQSDKNMQQFFQTMHDGLVGMTHLYLPQSIQSYFYENMTNMFDVDGNLLDDEDVLVLKVDGFPSAFYTNFDMTQLGNVEFYKALDPMIWFGMKLENSNGNLDDKNCAI